MNSIKLKYIHPYINTIGLQCQSFAYKNRFRLKHEFQLQTQLSDPLIAEIGENEEPFIIHDAPYEAFIDLKFQLDQQQTHSVHYQINKHSSVYLKSQFTNIGRVEGIYHPLHYIKKSNWEAYSLHLGYEYKNLAVEYNFKSSYTEAKIRFMFQTQFPWQYFKDMFSTALEPQHTNHIVQPKDECSEQKLVLTTCEEEAKPTHEVVVEKQTETESVINVHSNGEYIHEPNEPNMDKAVENLNETHAMPTLHQSAMLERSIGTPPMSTALPLQLGAGVVFGFVLGYIYGRIHLTDKIKCLISKARSYVQFVIRKHKKRK